MRLDFWSIPLRAWSGELAAIVLLVPVFLVVAIWNRFPFIYYDTGAYVFEGLGGHFLVERSPIYSLFLRFAGAGTSLWIVVSLQALATAFVLVEMARVVAPRLRLGAAVLGAALLVVGTSLPWYVGEIEPDCFTGITTLCIYLLAFHTRDLGFSRTVALALLGAFGAAAHPSHLVLAGFLFAILVAARIVHLFRHERRPEWRLAMPALVCSGALALTLGANFHYTHKIFLSKAGASFLFGRMLQDGIVIRLLDDTCPKSGYRLCAFRDSLPATGDAWLWTPTSPFSNLGHFVGTASESERIIRDALVRYPLMQLEKAGADVVQQFTRFGTGEGFDPQQWVLAPVFARYMPAQSSAYLAARQQRGEISFRTVKPVDVAIGWASLAALALMLGYGVWRGRARETALLAFVLAALIGNATVCGVLSGPHDRYQSRLIWIAPFAVLLAAASIRTNTNDASLVFVHR